MSLARSHRERVLAAQTAAAISDDGAAHVPGADPFPAPGATNADRAAAQMGMRLTHDLRRLKEIRAISLKIEAKREMLPDYRAWIEGLLAADAGVGVGLSAEVLPTYMIWLIDIGSYGDALDILPFVLRHNVAMPARYNRDAATIVLEEIADAALKVQGVGARFPLDILDRVADLTEGLDMHDEPRAKLAKAIGIEQLAAAEDMEANADAQAALLQTLNSLRLAQSLNPRIGVKDRVKRAEKLLAAIPPATDSTSIDAPPNENHEQGDQTTA